MCTINTFFTVFFLKIFAQILCPTDLPSPHNSARSNYNPAAGLFVHIYAVVRDSHVKKRLAGGGGQGALYGWGLGGGLFVRRGVNYAGLFDEAVFAEYFLDFFEGFGNLFLGVGGHEAEADKGVAGSHGGGDDGVDEDAFLKQFGGDGEGLHVVADEQGNDGR